MYKFYFQTLHKAIFMHLYVSATYCSHYQEATLLQRHKYHIVCQYGKYTHISFLQQVINVQYN